LARSVEWDDLPGAELVRKGLRDAELGNITPESLLLEVGKARLEACGIVVPPQLSCQEDAELRLYRLLGALEPSDTYSAYRSLLRRFISFEAGLERRWFGQPAAASPNFSAAVNTSASVTSR